MPSLRKEKLWLQTPKATAFMGPHCRLHDQLHTSCTDILVGSISEKGITAQ